MSFAGGVIWSGQGSRMWGCKEEHISCDGLEMELVVWELC